ncbi:MAG: response regulator [Nostoc sp. ZfuVER08]|jgi:two-component system NarL family response regulator|uniref:Response regulator transcription factor n=1 Tax=Nostoc punctiforme FACHB-252 TaxID=1357509 RepID=A0ABR8H745_NOSPU|nr:response regulator transcription factor [Nostoc punctiforme]MBD2611213.1 response regulator transcription factor [Nostoc punctiforme FACHB-252]MBL1199843.1 response regulator transcription factor [Nostoc sp. GBBB01]MDZ8014116.1 response regulator transcription factor [Nostoc sp. ZfuVER08]
MTKILLVEDDELFRLGLRMRLQQETTLEIVAEAEDGEQAVELANQYPLDLVLLDIGLPGIGGIEACRQIKQKHPNLPVLVLTSRSEKPLVSRLIAAGAQGYCLKGIPAESLILAVRSVAAGASWWDQTATTEIRAAFEGATTPIATKTPETLENPLTKREQEILALVAAGKSNQEIAEVLYIAPGTVRVHVHAILQKLEVRDRTQAAVLAIQKGLVAPELLIEQ